MLQVCMYVLCASAVGDVRGCRKYYAVQIFWLTLSTIANFAEMYTVHCWYNSYYTTTKYVKWEGTALMVSWFADEGENSNLYFWLSWSTHLKNSQPRLLLLVIIIIHIVWYNCIVVIYTVKTTIPTVRKSKCSIAATKPSETHSSGSCRRSSSSSPEKKGYTRTFISFLDWLKWIASSPARAEQ